MTYLRVRCELASGHCCSGSSSTAAAAAAAAPRTKLDGWMWCSQVNGTRSRHNNYDNIAWNVKWRRRQQTGRRQLINRLSAPDMTDGAARRRGSGIQPEPKLEAGSAATSRSRSQIVVRCRAHSVLQRTLSARSSSSCQQTKRVSQDATRMAPSCGASWPRDAPESINVFV